MVRLPYQFLYFYLIQPQLRFGGKRTLIIKRIDQMQLLLWSQDNQVKLAAKSQVHKPIKVT